jgi:hypothetical protein
MTAGDLALVVAVVLCALGFAALVVAVLAVRRSMIEVRAALDDVQVSVAHLTQQVQPLIVDLRDSVDTARDDLERFDRVLGSAEAISSAVEGTSRVARAALSTPVIKTVAFASGSKRALTGRSGRPALAPVPEPAPPTPRRRLRRRTNRKAG